MDAVCVAEAGSGADFCTGGIYWGIWYLYTIPYEENERQQPNGQTRDEETSVVKFCGEGAGWSAAG